MTILIYILFFAGLINTFRSPHWGIICLFASVALEKAIENYFPLTNSMPLIFGLATFTSYLFNMLLNREGINNYFDPIFMWMLVYIFYLVITSYQTMFFDADRNWTNTYVQLLVLIYLSYNCVTKEEHLVSLMTWFVIFNTAALLIFIFDPSFDLLKEGIEGANTTARSCIIGLFFAYYIQKITRSGLRKNVFRACIMILLVGIIYTSSRTVILLIPVYILIILYKDYKFNVRFAFPFIFVALLGYFLLPEELVTKTFDDISGESFKSGAGLTEYNKIDNNIRLLLWDAGFRMMDDHSFLLGIGVGNYRKLILDYLPILSEALGHPHNTYFSVLFESGILGLIPFMIMIVLAFQNYLRRPHKAGSIDLQATWLYAYIVFLIGGITKHDHYDKLLFLFLGISVTFSMLNRAQYREAENKVSPSYRRFKLRVR